MLDLRAAGNFLRSLPVVSSLFAKKEDSQEDPYEEIRRKLKIIERRLEMEGAFLFKQKSGYDERKILYHGWISAHKNQRDLLGALGVRGDLIHVEVDNRAWFNQCVCGKAAMEALILGFPTFWPGAFTACIGDEQLPHGLQEYWHYPNTLVFDDYVVDGKWKCPRCDAVMKIERRKCGNCLAYRTSLETDYP